MPHLFSYGTLQGEDVQLATFGRRLSGQPDRLVGYEPALVAIDDPAAVAALGITHYKDARRTDRKDDGVSGVVFEITEAELAKIERYEAGASYTPFLATLASGAQAWVYAHTAARSDPVELLFGGMEKLGPGSNADTLQVLRSLPQRSFRTVVDAGCGTGRQTLVLARELGTVVHALDSHAPFLEELAYRAREAQLGHLVAARCMDMQDIPRVFEGIDLLWSEGAAYNLGFSRALEEWAPALSANGLVVVSELCWFTDDVPSEVREFFRSGYPAMQSVEQNVAAAQAAAYAVLSTHVLARSAWTDGYYDVLEPRAKSLLRHPDAAVREFAAETIREIGIFDRSGSSYGYVFYVLNRA